MSSFFWHDYETWGATPSKDRPVQFAGIRTDLDLNIIDDPINILCKPTPDFLPHPEACLITGINPLMALEKGLDEREFVSQVHQQLSAPNTCGVGYNSIRFDDEVTRYSLWRNFYDPYEREWKNGNSRWDIIDMVRLCYAIRPEGIEWPTVEGVVSFKLENLSAANNLIHDAAHDALSDVYATIALAKLIKTKQPKLFDYLFELRDKRKAFELIDVVTTKPLLHVSSRFPAVHGCASLIVPLAMHPKNKNSVICYDLAHNPDSLLKLSADVILEKLYTPTADLAEGETRIALKEVHLNKSPVLATPKLLDESAAQRLNIDLDFCRENWRKLKGHTLTKKLNDVFSANPFNKSIEAEQSLYDGFIGNSDKSKCEQVRKASGSELASTLIAFEDKRLNDMLLRYRARNFPETLSYEEQELWHSYRVQKLTEPQPGCLTLDEFHEKVFTLQESGQLSAQKIQLLEDLSNYADMIL
ncbi:exodeoxyribonuclease I [Sessilibacter sp. MAH4]